MRWSSLRGVNCKEGGNILMQQDGDYQCVSENGGTDCYVHDYGTAVKFFYQPLTFWAELNDARPANSPPMTWWYVNALKISTPPPIEPGTLPRAIPSSPAEGFCRIASSDGLCFGLW